ncbi:type I restriction enzyme HsdR N-terminal domain-containing protein [Phormidium sp. LEGE 05292]|uniref:type I restriction enzyme HsdR N-terminal domain-containing protein n=1 Tax=[Phormidium] sp. LEGE 05292 TaxID=767427 RepID=UPI00187F2234|nr:type I restriction enzyme HsdR N-terminal domain-containing protein [Phormidium sp. LEGE 05292]MBE9224834.1 type I restriction enzyme HsdR N-terminal domain-containing protein [Phormidium sp. LEGE 05292]
METANYIPQRQIDIIAYNSEEQAILIAEVKALGFQNHQAKQQAFSQLKSYWQSWNRSISFVMLADLSEIEIFSGESVNVAEPLLTLKTADILSHYDPEFANTRILSPYFETLLEAWLRDLAYHWKSEKPPASDQVEEIGLLQLLADGTTKSEVVLESDNC